MNLSIRNSVLWAMVLLVAIVRMSDFAGLPYGNADDMTADFSAMRLGIWGSTMAAADAHGRIYYLFVLPLYGFMMRIAGTPWYDILNLGSFALGSLLPFVALRRSLGETTVQLYAVLYFALLPLLYSYCPPYAYPTYMFLPPLFCGLAILFYPARPRLAAVCFFLSLFGYEPSVLAVFGLYALAWFADPAGRPPLRWPVLLVAAYATLYIGFRLAAASTYEGVALALPASLGDALKVIGQLSSTSSIFGWYHSHVYLSYIDYATGASHLSPLTAQVPAFSWTAVPVAVLAAYLVSQPPRRSPRLLPLAAFLIVLPNLLYAFTPKLWTLVLDGAIPAYTGTRYSHFGLSLFLALALLALPRWPAVVLAVAILGWGWPATTEYTRTAALYARKQVSKWDAARALAVNASRLPPVYLNVIHAPRLWNSSTAPMSWGDPVQEAEYWDRWIHLHYGLKIHIVKEKPAGPHALLDYTLAPDGRLQSAVLSYAPAGGHYTETYVLRSTASTDSSN